MFRFIIPNCSKSNYIYNRVHELMLRHDRHALTTKHHAVMAASTWICYLTITRRRSCFDWCTAVWRCSDSSRLCLRFSRDLSAASFHLGRLLFAVLPLTFSYSLALLFRQQFVCVFFIVDEQIKPVISRNIERHLGWNVGMLPFVSCRRNAAVHFLVFLHIL